MAVGPEELHRRFTYHPPKDEQPEQYGRFRYQAEDMALLIDVECPDSREKDMALAALEQAVMWANAAIARRT